MALADAILTLQDGRIVDIDNHVTIPPRNSFVGDLSRSVEPGEDSVENESDATNPEVISEPSPESTDPADETDGQLADIRRKKGDISVYKYYLASSGYTSVVIYTIFIVTWMFCTEFTGRFLAVSLYQVLEKLTSNDSYLD